MQTLQESKDFKGFYIIPGYSNFAMNAEGTIIACVRVGNRQLGEKVKIYGGKTVNIKPDDISRHPNKLYYPTLANSLKNKIKSMTNQQETLSPVYSVNFRDLYVKKYEDTNQASLFLTIPATEIIDLIKSKKINSDQLGFSKELPLDVLESIAANQMKPWYLYSIVFHRIICTHNIPEVCVLLNTSFEQLLFRDTSNQPWLLTNDVKDIPYSCPMDEYINGKIISGDARIYSPGKIPPLPNGIRHIPTYSQSIPNSIFYLCDNKTYEIKKFNTYQEALAAINLAIDKSKYELFSDIIPFQVMHKLCTTKKNFMLRRNTNAIVPCNTIGEVARALHIPETDVLLRNLPEGWTLTTEETVKPESSVHSLPQQLISEGLTITDKGIVAKSGDSTMLIPIEQLDMLKRLILLQPVTPAPPVFTPYPINVPYPRGR